MGRKLFISVIQWFIMNISGSKQSKQAFFIQTIKSTIFHIGLSVLVLFLCAMPFFASANSQRADKGSIKEKVQAAFKDTPILFDIARCESRFRQFHSNGNVLFGGYRDGMVGLMQINAPVHNQQAIRLGYDIKTLEGNMAYAKYLYEQYGTRPWIDSKHCWEDYVNDGDGLLEMILDPLEYQANKEAVKRLQRTLNANNFVVAEEGAGSPGNETTYFGAKTRQAVREFQCAKQIACAGDPGYGRVGALTRKALNHLLRSENISSAQEKKEGEEDKDTLNLQEKVSMLQEKVKKLQKRIESIL